MNSVMQSFVLRVCVIFSVDQNAWVVAVNETARKFVLSSEVISLVEGRLLTSGNGEEFTDGS